MLSTEWIGTFPSSAKTSSLMAATNGGWLARLVRTTMLILVSGNWKADTKTMLRVCPIDSSVSCATPTISRLSPQKVICLADRIFIRPVTVRQRLVDDDNRRALRVVVGS